MIKFKSKGNFKKTEKYFKKLQGVSSRIDFNRIGRECVAALKEATPKDTGMTAQSWDYEVKRQRDRVVISFFNTNIQNGVPIAIILQYGHATGTGSWVEGIDYVNPAVQSIFDKYLREIWEEVTKSE